MTIHRGIIHGRTIELDEEPGLPAGQKVNVVVEPETTSLPPGEGLRRAFGTWTDDPQGLEEYLKWSRKQRKIARPELDS